ncbi:unnamed protein product [Boreogadus saida]
MRLRLKERIRIPHSVTIADWVSENLPSPGENPIDESMSASSNLVRTGMTTMLMAVNNLLDEGATSTDLEKFFGMTPKGGDLAAGWRIWSDEQRCLELTLYDRRRAGEQKEKSQNNKGESPPRIYRDPREGLWRGEPMERPKARIEEGTHSTTPHQPQRNLREPMERPKARIEDGTHSTKYLLKLMPDRQPRESEKDYVRRLLESGITTEQLEADIIRLRLRLKEGIRIPHSMTIADWVSCYQLPSPGENPIDESMSASSNLVRTGMTTMLMAVNNLLDEGATSTDLEMFFGMTPKGGDLAAGWRIWSDEHRYMELTLYDRHRAGEQKEKSQNNKGESPPRIYRDPREDRNNGNSQDGRYNNQQNKRKYSRPMERRTYGEAEGKDRGRNPFYNTPPTTEEPPRTYGEAEGEDRGWNPSTEQLEADIIRMRLRLKERIRIPHSMTIADWVSENLPSPGENPIDESMSASSNLVRTGMTTMLMAVNNLLDEGATSTDLEKFFGMTPKGGDLAAGWRIWSDEQRCLELTLYDRRRAGEQKEKSQNNKGESPPRIYRDPREDRNNGNSQDGRRTQLQDSCGTKRHNSHAASTPDGGWGPRTGPHQAPLCSTTRTLPTYSEGRRPPSLRGVFRGPGTRRNQLLRFQEEEWFKTNNIKLKNPEWTFNHVCGLRLGPRGWPQLDEDYQHIWPLISIREADHLMPYSTLVASTPEDTRRNPDRGIIRLSRKLFYHLPTRKRFCILESSNGQHNIYFEQPRAPYIWGWAPTSDVFGPHRPWRT